MRVSHFSSGGRYPVLRSLAILYLLGALVIAAGGLAVAGWVAFSAPDTMAHRMGLALATLAGTFFVTISMLAAAEVLKLFIDIEHNTRMEKRPVTSVPEMAEMRSNGGRLQWMEGEETAEAALLRGH